MSAPQPDVSVLIPTYNRRDYLQQAIESCFAGNDEIEVEVIVVDDGSTDGTRNYLRSLDDPRVRTVFQDQKGPQAARNRGMNHVRGRYFKQLDDDDHLLPEALQHQVQKLDQTGDPVCYGDPIVRTEKDGTEVRRELPAYQDLLVAISSGEAGVPTWNLIFLLDADIAKRCKWNEDLNHLHILAHLLTFCRHATRCVKVERPVAVHRIHSGPRVSEWADDTVTEQEREFNMYQMALDELPTDRDQEEALLQSMWSKAHIIAPFNWSRAQGKIEAVLQRSPKFHPRRNSGFISGLDQLIGPCWTERLINPVRRWRLRGESLFP